MLAFRSVSSILRRTPLVSASSSRLLSSFGSEEGSRIYCGNLPFSTTDEDLKQEFEKFGAVTLAKVITNRDTGRSRGFGFVTFADASMAESAIQSTNGAEIWGRTLAVAIAQEARPEGQRRQFGDKPAYPRREFNNNGGGFNGGNNYQRGGDREGGFRGGRSGGYNANRQEGGGRYGAPTRRFRDEE